MTTLLKLTRIYSLLELATPQEIDILYIYAGNLIRTPNPVLKLPMAEVLKKQDLADVYKWGQE